MANGDFRDFQRVDRLLGQALDRPANERQAFVERQCAGDPALLARLSALIAQADDASPELPAGGALALAARYGLAEIETPGPAACGGRIGPWRVDEVLGRGGMATVYRGERADGAYVQAVAIKVLNWHAGDDELDRRFERERAILARLEHPNIARMLDGGTTPSGHPFLVMELVAGEPIDRYCDRHRLSVDQRLRLFLTVAGAVRFAHRKLIVHRDLKPSNILVTAEGMPKLLDFGIAKLLEPDPESGELTRTALPHRLLTPQYASPEQIRGEPVSTATDVYALGLLLYELLSGHRARCVTSSSPAELEQMVCETQPSAPSVAAVRGIAEDRSRSARTAAEIAAERGLSPRRLRQRLAGDLDNIILKALRPEPECRYESAAQLAEDIHRHLNALPVQARPPSLWYRTDKFLRRHASGVAATVGVMVLVAVLTGIYTDRLARERDAAEQAAALARAESARATAALLETEQALNRAESLREFLVDLFRAVEPRRPRDQLTDTPEILALGAERALDSRSAPPGERLGMLLTLSEIYLHLRQLAEARPLIEAAVDLGEHYRTDQPGDLARALQLKAVLARIERRLGDSEALLVEAESLTAGDPALWPIHAGIRSDRGWLLLGLGKPERALELLEPLAERISAGPAEVPARLRLQVLNHLAGAYAQTADLDAAYAVRSGLLSLVEQQEGTESRDYAIQLNNMAIIELGLGRPEDALARLDLAIALYDRIFELQPTEFRAAARANRASALLQLNRNDEALAAMEAATVEWARLRGIGPERFADGHLYRGRLLVQMERWPEAERALEAARGLMLEADGSTPARLAEVAELLAEVESARNPGH